MKSNASSVLCDIKTALSTDGRVTKQEAVAIVARARRGGLSPQERTALRTGMLPNLDRFDVGAQRAFLEAGAGVCNPSVSDPLPTTAGGSYRPLLGQLVRNGLDYRDVRQGQLGDCFFLASLSAAAKMAPTELRQKFHPNADGSVSFRFYKRDPATDALVPTEVKVDRDVVERQRTISYARSADVAEIWPELYEKAYAKFLGNTYRNLNQGGSPADALEAITGLGASTLPLDESNPALLFDVVQQRLGAGKPVVAMSDDGKKYVDSGIVTNHAYTVIGATVSPDGTRYVQLRNPWGNTEPGKDGNNDGIFQITLASFAKHFCAIASVD